MRESEQELQRGGAACLQQSPWHEMCVYNSFKLGHSGHCEDSLFFAMMNLGLARKLAPEQSYQALSQQLNAT